MEELICTLCGGFCPAQNCNEFGWAVDCSRMGGFIYRKHPPVGNPDQAVFIPFDDRIEDPNHLICGFRISSDNFNFYI